MHLATTENQQIGCCSGTQPTHQRKSTDGVPGQQGELQQTVDSKVPSVAGEMTCVRSGVIDVTDWSKYTSSIHMNDALDTDTLVTLFVDCLLT
jgi:hypothetical protein